MRLAAALIVVLALAGVARSAPVVDLAPCERLAAVARSVPSTDWRKDGKLEDRLKPALQIQSDDEYDGSSFARTLADAPWVQHALGDPTNGSGMDHLSGTELYAAENIAGTAECQTLAFLRVGPGRRARLIEDPPFSSHSLCWTHTGGFGQVFGRGAFIESGLLQTTSDEDDIQMTFWTGQGWGSSCRLELHFEAAFTLDDRYCGDQGVCDAAAAIAVPLAAAYHRSLQGRTRYSEPFAFGPAPAADVAREIADLDPYGKLGRDIPAFPTFGGPGGQEYSTDFQLVPLVLNGRTYAAGLGYAGIGWRELGPILISIYAVENGVLKPLAGLSVSPFIKGLASAVAVPAESSGSF